MKFDEIDIKLLGLLQDDCKKTTKEYANQSKSFCYSCIRTHKTIGKISCHYQICGT